MIMKLEVCQFSESDVLIIEKIARDTWPNTFANILSEEQIEYMLNWMYNPSLLAKQMNEGHLFFGAKTKDKWLGFIGMEVVSQKDKVQQLKIHKLYVLPDNQSKGIGFLLMQKAIEVAKNQNVFSITLNVNRFNKALDFYLRLGMTIEKEENIDIGNGFWMEDYVLRLDL